MAKEALVIGSQAGGLSGVETDVRAMTQVLERYGFVVRQCVGASATRFGILIAYNRLIEDTMKDDAIVVYYSGHGARGVVERGVTDDSHDAPISMYYQFIVPTDIHESTHQDFRGITNLELSLLMGRLTDKARNVTVILDCCHAARMSRGLQMTPRALPGLWYVGVAAHLDRLKGTGIDVSRLNVESNPYAIRLVAAGPNQSAYEYTNANGETTGMLTESLRIALEEAYGLPVTWSALIARIRNRVLSLEPTQRPELEGCVDRLLFDLQSIEQTSVLQVSRENGRLVLQGGRIFGVEVGDEYALMPLVALKFDPVGEIARATVTKVVGGRSQIAVKFHTGHDSVPDGARAFPIRRALHKLAVRIRGDRDTTAALRESVEASSHFRLFVNDDPAETLAELDVSDNQITMLDTERRLLVEPKPFTQAAIRETIENLKQFAQARHLRMLSGGTGPLELRQPFEVEWGLVKRGNRQALPSFGSLLHVGDPVYVRVHNKSNGNLYASMFDIGLGGKITLLTASEPSGVELQPCQEYILGYREYYGLEGLPLQWADSIPSDGLRSESIVVIVSDRPQNLRVFEQRGMRSPGGAPDSPLQDLLTHFAHGGTRGVSFGNSKADVRYAVHHIDFLLDARNRPLENGSS